jgi:hypothetical protein
MPDAMTDLVLHSDEGRDAAPTTCLMPATDAPKFAECRWRPIWAFVAAP